MLKARMRDTSTSWVDLKGKKHKQSMVFTGAKQEKVVSSFGGRKKKKEDPEPPRAGQPKGLHQVLWERGLVPKTLSPCRRVDPTSREGKVLEFLEIEGRMDEVTTDPDHWSSV